METPVLIAILSFAGVLIGLLAGSRGQKALDRRNGRNNQYPGKPCAFDQKAWDDLWQQEREWRGKLWDKHDFLEDEIKDNRALIRDELRENRREIVAAIDGSQAAVVTAITTLNASLVAAIGTISTRPQ